MDGDGGEIEQEYQFEWEDDVINLGQGRVDDGESLMISLENELSIEDESLGDSQRGNVDLEGDIDNETRSDIDEGSDVDNDDFSHGDNYAGALHANDEDSRSLGEYLEVE